MKKSTERIIDRINREIGSDLKNLHKSRNIVKDYKDRIKELEDEVGLSDGKSKIDIQRVQIVNVCWIVFFQTPGAGRW